MAAAITRAYLHRAAQPSASDKRALICTPPGPAQSQRSLCTFSRCGKCIFRRKNFQFCKNFGESERTVCTFRARFSTDKFRFICKEIHNVCKHFHRKCSDLLTDQVKICCQTRQKIRRISPPEGGVCRRTVRLARCLIRRMQLI